MGLFRAEAAGPAEDGCLPGLCLHGRRGFLKSFGAAALAAPSLALAQQPAPAPRRIDVHHHVYPTRWFAAKRDLILGSSDNPPTIMTQWTPQRAVEQMDKHGIATSIACLGNPGVWFGDVQEARALMRMCNEYMAQLGQDFPGRFGAFAALALPDVEGCLNEIAFGESEITDLTASIPQAALGAPPDDAPIKCAIKSRRAGECRRALLVRLGGGALAQPRGAFEIA